MPGATLNLNLVQGSGQRIRYRCREQGGGVVSDITSWLFTITIANGVGTPIYVYTNDGDTTVTFDTSSGNSDAWVQITADQTAALTVDDDYTISTVVIAPAREPWALTGGVVTVQDLARSGEGEADVTVVAYLDGPVVVDATATLPGSPGDTGPAGADGVGVPVGGTIGQFLKKLSGTDYDTGWSDAPPLLIGHTLYVDAVNGDDATGVSGNASKPYLTLAAALAAAVFGDLIEVGTGAYQAFDSLATDGVNWHFCLGASVTFTEDSSKGVWDDGGNPMSFSVDGEGDFSRFDADGTFVKRVIVCSHASSKMLIKCRDIIVGDDAGIAADEAIRCSAGELTVQCRDVLSYSDGGAGVWWSNGFMDVTGRRTFGGLAGVYSAPTGTPTGDGHVRFEEIESDHTYGIYENGDEPTAAIWIRCNTVKTVVDAAIAAQGASRIYVECQKTFGAIASTGTGLLYVRSDKVSATATGGYLYSRSGSGTSYIHVNHWDGSLVVNAAIRCSGGTTSLFGGELTTVSGGGGITISAGTLRAHDLRIDTSASSTTNPVLKSGGTLVLDNCSLIAQSSADSISAAAAQSVAVEGTLMVNRPLNGNVTLTGGPLCRSDTGVITPNAPIAGSISGNAATATLAATASAVAVSGITGLGSDVATFLASPTVSALRKVMPSVGTGAIVRVDPTTHSAVKDCLLAANVTGVLDGGNITSAVTSSKSKTWTPSGNPTWRSGASSNACPNGYPCIEVSDARTLISNYLSSDINFTADNWSLIFVVAVPFGSMNDPTDASNTYPIGGFWQASPTTAFAGVNAGTLNYYGQTFKTGTNTNASWGLRIGGHQFRVVTLDSRAGTANIRVNGVSNPIGTTNTFATTDPAFAVAVGLMIGANYASFSTAIKHAAVVAVRGSTLTELAGMEAWLADLCGVAYDKPFAGHQADQLNLVNKKTVIAPYWSDPGYVGNTHNVPASEAILTVQGAVHFLAEPVTGNTSGIPHFIGSSNFQNNVLNICELGGGGFSAIATLDSNLTERGAFGFGNANSGDARFVGFFFHELSNIPTSGAFGTPAPFRTMSTHAGGTSYQHITVTPSDGSVKIWNKVAFNTDWAAGQVTAFTSDGSGNVTLGNTALATSATNGFPQVPAMAGTPSGSVTPVTGFSTIHVDTTGGKLWSRYGGAWHSVLFDNAMSVASATSGRFYYASSTTAFSASGLRITGGGLLSNPSGSSGTENEIFGDGAGTSLTTASQCTFFGHNAGNLCNANNNIAIGDNALGGATVTGTGNVALGGSAGFNTKGAGDCMFIGTSAGYNVTTGGGHVLIGTAAGQTSSTNIRTVCIGVQAGNNNTADLLVAIGTFAAYTNSTGTHNTAVGYSAGNGSLDTGTDNTLLGYNSQTAGGTINNAIAIGSGANAGEGELAFNPNTAVVRIDNRTIRAGTAAGLLIGNATSEKIGFHNSAPVIQRASAAQAAVITTAATNVAPYGFVTQAQADALVTLVNELRAALVEKGLIKGSA